MRTFFLAASLLIAAFASALAQPAASTVLTPLPSPAVAPEARPSDILHAALGAVAAGRLGEAQEALEEAQTRILDRSVPLGQTHNPSDNPAVAQISQALQALATQDRATAIQIIQTAIASATAQGL